MSKIVWHVEDDDAVASEVQAGLEAAGFCVRAFSDGLSIRNALTQGSPDALLIDWNLPDDTGPSLCRWARLHDEQLPILMVTVRDDPEDVVQGLASGADDHVTKPFVMKVLISRIEAVLRRTPPQRPRYACGDLLMDDERHAVTLHQQPLELSPLEYDLLLLFLQNKGHIVSRDAIRASAWRASDSCVSDNTITVAVKRLRAKLGKSCSLKTVRSFGYRLEEPL